MRKERDEANYVIRYILLAGVILIAFLLMIKGVMWLFKHMGR